MNTFQWDPYFIHNLIQPISIQTALFLSLTTRWRPGAHVSLLLLPPLPRRPSSRERARSGALAACGSCGRARRSAAATPSRLGGDSEDPDPCGSCYPPRALPEVRAEGRCPGTVFPGAAALGRGSEEGCFRSVPVPLSAFRRRLRPRPGRLRKRDRRTVGLRVGTAVSSRAPGRSVAAASLPRPTARFSVAGPAPPAKPALPRLTGPAELSLGRPPVVASSVFSSWPNT